VTKPVESNAGALREKAFRVDAGGNNTYNYVVVVYLSDAEAEIAAAEQRGAARVAELMEENAASSWQPIETAPQDGTNVLIAFADRHIQLWQTRVQDGKWMWYEVGPTHWMPLPEPPQPGAEEKEQPK